MTRWHANTELLTTLAVAAGAVYTATKLEAGLGLDAAVHLESGLSDTSG